MLSGKDGGSFMAAKRKVSGVYDIKSALDGYSEGAIGMKFCFVFARVCNLVIALSKHNEPRFRRRKRGS